MNQHRRGISFDYILLLNGVTPGEFVGWSVEARMFRDKWDADAEQNPPLLAEWVDSSAAAVHVLALDTSGWELGRSFLDVRFTRPSDGYVRGIKGLIEWTITK